MIIKRVTLGLLVCAASCIFARAQTPPDDPDVLLKQALRYADLYNWSDAAPLFTHAEQLFDARGDTRNALYARLGRLRSTMEQLSLPEVSEELGAELDESPLLQSDNELRLFCLMVRGDIDGEIDAAPMRRDWEAALKLAQVLGDKKWENRASGEIGFAMFLQGDMAAAREKVAGALIGATMLRDAGAQIRYLAAIGQAFAHLGSFDGALGYFDRALQVAAKNPDVGYPFLIHQGRLQALRGMGKLDAAQQLADEIIAQARATQRHVKETIALITASTVAIAKGDEARAVEQLEVAIALAQKGGFKRLLANAQFNLADVYRQTGDLPKAESLVTAAAESTQNSGDIYPLPMRLRVLAQIKASQGKYLDASATYDRASDILDAMIGSVTSTHGRIGLITAMSAVYTEHFALVADHLNDTAKAFLVLERARGRVTTDLLMSGRRSDSTQRTELLNRISRLNLELTKAESSEQIRQIRDKIFLAEQARWLTPGSSPLKSEPWKTVPLEDVRASLAANELVLEYVVAERRSYCLAISRNLARVIPLASRKTIEELVGTYLKTLKAKRASKQEGMQLYTTLIKDIPDVEKKKRLIIVPDGILHVLPFEALVDGSGRYLVSSHTITYARSASGMFLAKSLPPNAPAKRMLLGVGGIPYDQTEELKKLAMMRGYLDSTLVDLPASKEEIAAAQTSLRAGGNTLLLGSKATKFAFKESTAEPHAVIHLAVHAVSNQKHPDRAALILLSDQQSGDDGILEASEIVHLRADADLVVLSACDTAVGSLQGQEGIANLSLAFRLAGAKAVLSTLWSIDDISTLYVMKRFYAHLADRKAPARALTAAKRDMLKAYAARALPYYWAGFKLEGAGDYPIGFSSKNPRTPN